MSFHVVGGDVGENVEVTPLGSGREVGRSAVVVKFRGKTVLFDCGVHPARSGHDSLPYFDEIDASTIDVCLVTHFHLDHCGAVPYLLNETKFNGRIVMTHPTRKIFRMVMQDFMRVTPNEAQKLCTDQWLERAMDHIETLDYHQESQHNGVRYHSYNAGHVLGAAMWMVEISGVRILYTGDFSREEDRHLLGAELPAVKPDVLIVESTYGIATHESRQVREEKFCSYIKECVLNDGKCLLPVFAMGRAQELLLILEDFWANNKDLQQIPVFFASSFGKKCNTVFETYTNLMNDSVKEQCASLKENRNPFVYKYIQLLKDVDDFEHNNTGPAVVMASPGMLQSGQSRRLFDRWCTDKKNCVVISGYTVPGTTGFQIQQEGGPHYIQRGGGAMVPVHCGVKTVSFSAHSDYTQTSDFVNELGVKHAVLVHGDGKQMDKLGARMMETIGGLKCYMPANVKTVSIPVRPERICRVVGAAAERLRDGARDVGGVMLVNQETDARTVLHPEDIATFTELPVARITQSVHLPLSKYYPLSDIHDHLSIYFAGASIVDPSQIARTGGGDAAEVLRIGSSVTVALEHSSTAGGGETTAVSVSWDSTRFVDIVADAACLALLRLTTDANTPLAQDAADEIFRLRCLHKLLGQHFLSVSLDVAKKEFKFESNGIPVRAVAPFQVECSSPTEQKRVENVLYRAFLTLYPLPEHFGWCACGNHNDDTTPSKRRRLEDQTPHPHAAFDDMC